MGKAGEDPESEPPPAAVVEMEEFKRWSLYKAVITEFVATLLLLYISIGTIISSDQREKGGIGPGVGILGIAWSFGATIFVLVYCCAGISGGHINPAVTFAFFVTRRVTLPRALLYMIAQCLGAICGAGLVKGWQRSFYEDNGGGANVVSHGYTKGTALGAEIVGTYLLVFTVLSATDPLKNARESHIPVLAPLPIGLAVFVVHLATIPITGTSINPARSLGPAIMYNRRQVWDDHWIFWVGPFVGSSLAAAYYRFVLKDKLPDKIPHPHP